MEERLLQAAWQALERAYAPYSRFRVGAALETESGAVFAGCNVEVVNYGCTLCAERTAIVKAVSEGELRPGGLKRLLVAAPTSKPTAPCGSCRQMIEEFAGSDTLVLLSNQPGRISARLSHAELLPWSFNSNDLKNSLESR